MPDTIPDKFGPWFVCTGKPYADEWGESQSVGMTVARTLCSTSLSVASGTN